MVTAGADGTARTWDISSGRIVLRGSVSGSAADPTSSLVGISTWDGTLSLIDTESDQVVSTLDGDAPLTTVSFSGDGSLVAAGGLDGVGRVWETSSGDLVTELRGHERDLYMAVDFFAQSDRVTSWSDDGTARIWDARSGRELAVFRHGDPDEGGGILEALANRRGDRLLTTGLADGVIQMWDVATGEELWSQDRLIDPGGVPGAISPDGEMVGTTAGSEAIVWDGNTGQKLSVLQGAAGISRMVFSPDGDWVVTDGADGVARIWDPGTGRLLQEMPGHPGIDSVNLDDRGRWVVTTADDGVTRIWDAVLGDLVASYGGGGGAGRFALFADNHVVVSNSDNAVRIDRCDTCGTPEELLVLARERVTRTLTNAERSAYLGTSMQTDDSFDQHPSGLETTNGATVSDGLITPGRYRTAGLEPEISFELQDDWFAHVDTSEEEGASTYGRVVQLQRIDSPSDGLSFIWLSPGRVIDGRKEWDERLNVAPWPDDFPGWLASHPNLIAAEPRPITVGGADGISVRTRVSSVPTENPWPNCGGCVTLFALGLRNQTGPITVDDAINALAPGELDSWIVLETREGVLLVNAFSADRKSFQRFMPLVERVLKTVSVEGASS